MGELKVAQCVCLLTYSWFEPLVDQKRRKFRNLLVCVHRICDENLSCREGGEQKV